MVSSCRKSIHVKVENPDNTEYELLWTASHQNAGKNMGEIESLLGHTAYSEMIG
jgi:hypothetical protein